jgi:hypothetical protein
MTITVTANGNPLVEIDDANNITVSFEPVTVTLTS